ncbi:MAG: hypothetical protein ACI4NW_03370 [Stenotrophomonas sp.]
MHKQTPMAVLGAGLRGVVAGVVLAAAFGQGWKAWQTGALWQGLAAPAVALLTAWFLARTLRAPRQQSPVTESR